MGATTHIGELSDLIATCCPAVAELQVRVLVATMALGAAGVTASGLLRLRSPILDRSAVLRALVVAAAAAACIAGTAGALVVLGLPDPAVRGAVVSASAIVATGLAAGLLTAAGRRGSAVHHGGAPHRKPPVEFGLHAELPGE